MRRTLLLLTGCLLATAALPGCTKKHDKPTGKQGALSKSTEFKDYASVPKGETAWVDGEESKGVEFVSRKGGDNIVLEVTKGAAEEQRRVRRCFPADRYLNKRMRLSSEVKTQLKGGNAKLTIWIGYTDSDRPPLLLTSPDKNLHGKADYTMSTLDVEVPGDSAMICVGGLASKESVGKVWFKGTKFAVLL